MELANFVIEKLKENNKLREEKTRFKDKEINLYILELNNLDEDLIFTSAYYIIDENNTVFIDKKDNRFFIYLFLTNKNKIIEFFNQIVNYYFYRKENKKSIEIKKYLLELFLYGNRKE
ncbi:MAG: hypothetical protein ABGW69_04020 [Nanoarchaeota archaeon]